MIFLPEGLEAANPLLQKYAIAPRSRMEGQVLRILLLNLMPEKAVTEVDMVRMLEGAGYDIELIPLRIAGQRYKTTPQVYVEAFYTDYEEVKAERFDGLIVTGAPIEHLEFEEVRYWGQLTAIMDWAQTHVRSTLYICWGAQAALYHQWQVAKYGLDAKMFGVFPYRALAEAKILENVAQPFPMPTSRHTEVRREDFPSSPALLLLAESNEAGVGMALAHEGREIYITGHLEYALPRLNNEYERDRLKGKDIAPPQYYYGTDGCPVYSWEQTALQIYHNWVRHYVVR